MATIEKYTNNAARDLIGHVERSLNFGNMSNQEIDFTRSHENYNVGISREHPFQYYKALLERCYVYGRDDVKTLVGVIFPLPHDTPHGEERAFFEACYDFLKYNFFPEAAIISSQVHVDESRPHLHVLAVPVAVNTNKSGNFRYKEPPPAGKPDTRRTAEKFKLKVSANDVISRNSYFKFHDDLQEYINACGIKATVKTGITKAQGGALTVRELKRENSRERVEREAKIKQNLQRESRWISHGHGYENERNR